MTEIVEERLNALDLGYFEVQFALEGLAPENVWKRPAPGLLSVGELAGHIAYWEATRLASETGEYPEPDLARCKVKSPLIDNRFGYYPKTLSTSPSDEQRAMTAEQVYKELLRVHEEAVAHFKSANPALETVAPGWPANFTYAEFLRYTPFHIAYHIGQMYSVRHLLGEETPDN